MYQWKYIRKQRKKKTNRKLAKKIKGEEGRERHTYRERGWEEGERARGKKRGKIWRNKGDKGQSHQYRACT